MHHMVANKTHHEKDKWQQLKNDLRFLKQILGAIPHKRAAVSPLGSHLTNYLVKTNRALEYCWKIKDELINDFLL